MQVQTYLFFDGRCQKAIDFYCQGPLNVDRSAPPLDRHGGRPSTPLFSHVKAWMPTFEA
jgi:hypothetical protein